jgi:hypothetical protein
MRNSERVIGGILGGLCTVGIVLYAFQNFATDHARIFHILVSYGLVYLVVASLIYRIRKQFGIGLSIGVFVPLVIFILLQLSVAVAYWFK